jgi:UDP-GlcNAc:undecaprenyl-phosphate/decaprenyl-phosphate GlcNAc-1-phosphate transferase
MRYAITAAVISFFAILALRQLALKIDWMDRPDERKAHKSPVPAVGGIAWILGLTGGLCAAGAWGFAPQWGALVLLCLVGAFDDVRPLPSVLRLAFQAVAALLAIYPQGLILANFGELFWPGLSTVLPAWVAWPVTIFACVGVINAVNMIDGMDGSLSVVVGVCLVLLIALFHRSGHNSEALLAGVAFAALVPFVFFNTRTPWLERASLFFGDAGSTAIGLLLAWLLVRGTQGPAAAFKPVTALFLLAVPIVDTVSLMLRRVARGHSPFKPDQEHVHHLLQRLGYDVKQSVWLLLGISMFTAAIGLLLATFGAPEWVSMLVFLGMALGYHFMVQRSIKNGYCFGRALAHGIR